MFIGRGAMTDDLRRLYPFFSDNAVLPEFFTETKFSATVPAGHHVFWLGLGHYYESGFGWAIADVKRNGEPAPTSSWSYPEPRAIGTGVAPLSPKESLSLVNRTFANLFWWIELNNNLTEAVWEVTLRERWITANPLRVSTVRTDGEFSTNFDISVRWLHSGGISTGTAHKANVNAIAVWGAPDGYEVELWGIHLHRKARSSTSTRLQRARIWRPWLRIAPTEKRSGQNVVIIPAGLLKNSKRILGVALYNPATGARSPIRRIGPVGHKPSARLNRLIHAIP